MYTVEPLLRGHPDERPTPLERPLYNVNISINVLIYAPDERPPLLKGHISGTNRVASQEGFHCNNRSIDASNEEGGLKGKENGKIRRASIIYTLYY